MGWGGVGQIIKGLECYSQEVGLYVGGNGQPWMSDKQDGTWLYLIFGKFSLVATE